MLTRWAGATKVRLGGDLPNLSPPPPRPLARPVLHSHAASRREQFPLCTGTVYVTFTLPCTHRIVQNDLEVIAGPQGGEGFGGRDPLALPFEWDSDHAAGFATGTAIVGVAFTLGMLVGHLL